MVTWRSSFSKMYGGPLSDIFVGCSRSMRLWILWMELAFWILLIYVLPTGVDGYGPHLKQMDRWQFGDSLMRHNHLALDGWKEFRFSSDDVEHKNRRCQQFVLHLIGSLYGDGQGLGVLELSLREREVLRFVAEAEHAVTPANVGASMGLHPEYCRQVMQRLTGMQLFKGASGKERIRTYMLDSGGARLFL